jgi:hypothetical protein
MAQDRFQLQDFVITTARLRVPLKVAFLTHVGNCQLLKKDYASLLSFK